MYKKILQIFALALIGLTSTSYVLAEQKEPLRSEKRRTQQMLSSEQLLEDLAFVKQRIAAVHPEPSFTANMPQVEYIFKELEASFRRPMERDEAWRLFSKLNPYFADGHFYIGYQSTKDEVLAHQARGEGLFPFNVEVQISPLGSPSALIVGGVEDDRAVRWNGYQILQINQKPIRDILLELMSGMPGDTTGFGAQLLSRRFWFLYLKHFGATRSFDLLLAKGTDTVRIRQNASMKLPAALMKVSKFDEQFKFEILDPQTALLTISEFAWEQDEKSYFAFTRDAFRQMKERGIQRLFIDIRENTGGNDHMWKLGLLNYFADKRYRNGSSYRKKVLEGRQSGTEKVGDVVDGFVDSWVEPNTTEPYFFKGKVYLLVGRLTYSSSILLANVVQDFGFSTVVGDHSRVRARQTGGINQINVLPNSKLEIVIPRFIVDRPSGQRTPALVQPDIVLTDDPLEKRALVRDLMHYLDRKTEK